MIFLNYIEKKLRQKLLAKNRNWSRKKKLEHTNWSRKIKIGQQKNQPEEKTNPRKKPTR